MALADRLFTEVSNTLQAAWQTRRGRDVPDAETVGLGNRGVELDAAVLYADLADSTELVDVYPAQFAAEVYKTYLLCAARIINDEGGSITAYDGDRIMAVFVGANKEDTATRAALRINTAVEYVLRPAMAAQYPVYKYVLQSKVGIDVSPLLVAKTGIRGANDLVWVGRAANYAAKLAALKGASIFITEDVFSKLTQLYRTRLDGQDVWVAHLWPEKNNLGVYTTDCVWTVL